MQAFGQGGVEAFHVQDAVHAVHAKEQRSVPNLAGGGQNLGSLGVVDGQEDQISAGFLALGNLSGQVGLGVSGESFGANDFQALNLSLFGEAFQNAGGVNIGGIVDYADLSAQALGGDNLSRDLALCGVDEANLEHVVASVGNVRGGSGRSHHEDAVSVGLGAHGQAGLGGDGAAHHLHAPVLQGVVSRDGLLGVVLIVLAVQFKLQAAQSVDFVNSDLCSAGNSSAVNGSAAGQRTGHTDLNGAGISGSADGEHGGNHSEGQNQCE